MTSKREFANGDDLEDRELEAFRESIHIVLVKLLPVDNEIAYIKSEILAFIECKDKRIVEI